MPDFKDLTGQYIGRWHVIKRMPDKITPKGNHYTRWLCECECGTVREINANSLLNGKSRSCGCFQRERSAEIASELFSIHHETKSRLYQCWASMKARCYDPRNIGYANYGGRGIRVCAEWLSYEPFRDWAMSNGYRDELTLDRIDFNGNYEPNNCRWATHIEQSNNRRSNVFLEYNGEKHTIADWARLAGIPYGTFHSKFRRGCSLAQILTH